MVLNRDKCVKAMMDQHLSKRSTYEIIMKKEAKEHLTAASRAFIDYVSMQENKIDVNNFQCVMRNLDQDTIIPVMHGPGKSHK